MEQDQVKHEYTEAYSGDEVTIYRDGKPVHCFKIKAAKAVEDTSGPAFPESCNGQIFSGMTLRQYFAAKAMQALIADSSTRVPPNLLAQDAYIYADEMMEAGQA